MPFDAHEEFDRQLQNLIESGYPALSGLPAGKFRSYVAPLAQRLDELPAVVHDTHIPFVIVVTCDLVPTEAAMSQVRVNGKPGVVNMRPVGPDVFAPIAAVELPAASAYLAVDIDTGSATLGVRPNDALPILEAGGRSPLTIDEGVALLTHFPDILQTHNAYQMLGSRAGDKRVPAIWVSYGQPRLGWCWAGNPHSWLGMASAATRVAV